MSKATVYLREEKERKEVQIGGKDKVKISASIKEKWQKILDLAAEIFDVPAALIMHITDSHLEVFLKDNNPNNPYPEDGKDNLSHGLYCETVIGRDHSFEVENALKDDNWKDNPDVKLNMISYFGLPIKWSDGSFFGTICVLSDEETSYKAKYKKLLSHFRDFIESDLYHLELQYTLERKSYRDHLTGIGNRRKFDKELAEAFENYIRYEHPFALVIIDIDHFKDLNDKYGHLAGDKALMKFSETISKRVRKTDYFCRIGGDEFVVLLKESNDDNIQQFLSDVKHRIQENEFLSDKDVSITTGYSIMSEKIENKDELFELADQNLYQNKKED